MSFRVAIPARYASTRLPGKPLVSIAGKPLIQWVYERALRSAASEVVIVTDDARIAQAARSFGAAVIETAANHESGTDRIAEAARTGGWRDDEIVVNLQGDEPLMPPALIDQVAGLLDASSAPTFGFGIATLSFSIKSLEDFLNPHVVKVVTDTEGRALYFSRAPIPWNREGAPAGFASQQGYGGAQRHIGLYAYRVGSLQRFAALPASELETVEKLEQLRALENGMAIRVAQARELPGPDVNTQADVERVASLLEGRKT